MAQARYWLLTINDSDDGESWNACTELPNGVQWIRGQKEIGANTGRPHWQVYVAFKRAVRLAAVRKLFGTRVHAESCRSEAAADYVFKDETAIAGTRFEFGSRAIKRNSATDWALVKKNAKEGNLDDIPEDIYIKHYSTLKRIERDHMKPPADLSSCSGIWIYGPPGVGKSHFVREQWPDLYLKPQNKWWDGYSGQKNVLLDDFDCKVMGHYLKIWGDKYAFIAESKGNSISIRPNNFIVTSNYRIEDLFDDPVLCEAIKRRFYVIHIPMKRY